MMVFSGSAPKHLNAIVCHLVRQERQCVKISDILIHRLKPRLQVTVHAKDVARISSFQTQIKNGIEWGAVRFYHDLLFKEVQLSSRRNYSGM